MLARSTAALTIVLLATAAFAADDLGKELFNKNCINCHAADGSGKTNTRTKVEDLRSPQVQAKSDAELYDSIAHGAHHKDYPHAYEMRGMTKEQINAMVAHIRTFKR